MSDEVGEGAPVDRLRALAIAAADGFSTLGLSAGGGLAEDVGGARCWYSSSYLPVFNGAGLFTQDLYNPRTLAAIDRYFRSRGRSYCVAMLDGLVPGADRTLLEYGFSEYDALPAMWLDGPPAVSVMQLDGLEIEQVQTPEDLATYRRLLSQVFHLPANEVNLVMGERVLQVPQARHFLVCLHGEPVATVSLVLEGDVPGIWNVGTLHEFRRRGISTAAMHYVLSLVRDLGYQSSMLLASKAGLPIYRRLGFRTLSTLRLFVR